MTSFTFCQTPLKEIVEYPFEWKFGDKIPQVKYWDLESGKKLMDPDDCLGVWSILSLMLQHTEHKKKHWYLDIKVQDLVEGQTPCLPGWHTDLAVDPLKHPGNDVHLMYIAGYHCRTEFIADPVELLIKNDCKGDDERMLHDFRYQLHGIDFRRTKMKDRTLYRFDRFNFHRGTAATASARRLLMRLTCTDLERPSNHYGYYEVF